MKLGFIGCGNMAKAMLGGILKNEICAKEDVIATAKSEASRENARNTYGIQVTADNIEAAKSADVLVLATPVYFYSIDAQLKTLVDRSLARWREVRGKELYYIVTMAEAELSAADTTLACLHGYADCVAGAVERGTIIGSGVYEPGKVLGTPAMEKAYRMGKTI